jgi:glutamate synthase (ferredoxin)
MVYLERLDDGSETRDVEAMIRQHAEYTNSELAWRILGDWECKIPKFVKVMPKDYKRMLEAFERVKALGLSGEEAVMAAFEQNKNDLARVSGN